MLGEPIKRFGHRPPHRLKVGETVIGLIQDREAFDAAQAVIKFLGFDHTMAENYRAARLNFGRVVQHAEERFAAAIMKTHSLFGHWHEFEPRPGISARRHGTHRFRYL